MFDLAIAQALFEEADKEYQKAKKEYEENGITTESLKRLYITNVARVDAKKKLDKIKPVG